VLLCLSSNKLVPETYPAYLDTKQQRVYRTRSNWRSTLRFKLKIARLYLHVLSCFETRVEACARVEGKCVTVTVESGEVRLYEACYYNGLFLGFGVWLWGQR
jgi:hypothetical protein